MESELQALHRSEDGFMNFSQSFQALLQYLSEAVARIFSPRDDDYPATGVQPYTGEPYRDGYWRDGEF